MSNSEHELAVCPCNNYPTPHCPPYWSLLAKAKPADGGMWFLPSVWQLWGHIWYIEPRLGPPRTRKTLIYYSEYNRWLVGSGQIPGAQFRLHRNFGAGIYCCLQIFIESVENVEPNSSQRGLVTEEAVATNIWGICWWNIKKNFFTMLMLKHTRDPREVVDLWLWRYSKLNWLLTQATWFKWQGLRVNDL